MRFLYSLLLLLLLPVSFAALFWRTLRQTGRPDRLGERFGSSPYFPPGEILWVHGASVGEIRAAAPLVNALHRSHPHRPLLVTSFTGAGRVQAEQLFAGRAMTAQLPYDLPFCVRRWLKCVNPAVGVILETEIWPNLFAACARRGVPLVMLSARLSARSLERYRRFPRLVRGALAQVSAIAAQTAADAEGFHLLGVPRERLAVIGNLKFDVQFPEVLVQEGAALRARLFGASLVVVAGSTREGEESLVLEAFCALRVRHPGSLLVLAPRHPERAAAVAAVIAARGLACRRRSAGETPLQPGEVLLVDVLGQLMRFYAAADIAFVGGTLVPVGGHNLLEPAALGLPVLAGPHLANVSDIAKLLKEAGGLTVVSDAAALGEALIWLAEQPATRRQIGAAARATVEKNRGALDRGIEIVKRVLERG